MADHDLRVDFPALTSAGRRVGAVSSEVGTVSRRLVAELQELAGLVGDTGLSRALAQVAGQTAVAGRDVEAAIAALGKTSVAAASTLQRTDQDLAGQRTRA